MPPQSPGTALNFKKQSIDARYHIGDTAVLRAIPAAGYRFAGWSDGETAAERSIVVEDSVWLTATFEEEE